MVRAYSERGIAGGQDVPNGWVHFVPLGAVSSAKRGSWLVDMLRTVL